ncbi:hypothetical protein GCM10010254_04260 [Streptomyces chromofuscus]|nr:hypothetical protein GCM10010254_04260 [Streptomyces chromofuscus]
MVMLTVPEDRLGDLGMYLQEGQRGSAGVPSEADRDPADPGALHEPVEGPGEAHRVDRAAVLRGEDQVMVLLLPA